MFKNPQPQQQQQQQVCDPSLLSDAQPCLSTYFLNKIMPLGLWDAANHPSLCFKCQTLSPKYQKRYGDPPGKDYFATVFDGDDGIAILSAYIVTAKAKIPKKKADRNDDWQETTGKLLDLPWDPTSALYWVDSR